MKQNYLQDRASGLRLYERWLSAIGVSRTTGWRWRRDGWVRTLNVAGKLYLTDEEVDRFLQRVKAGEFTKQPKVPTQTSVDSPTPRRASSADSKTTARI
jgi:hypothetical protein